MKENLQTKKNYMIMGIIFLITMFIACSPLFTENCINGHDVEYHLLRIESLKEGILIGKPFLKVNVLFLGGAGYASSMFYPDFLLYIPALLRVMGVGINASYHIFVGVCFVLCYGVTYFSVKYMTRSSYAAAVAAVLLSLCEYHIDDVYTRSAVGEYTAFIFVPLIICGIYDLIYCKMQKPWILGAGFAGVLLCHTNTCVMCIIICILFLLFQIKTLIQQPRVLLRLFLTAVVTMLLTMFYWLPMLEQMLSTVFHVSTAWIMPAETMQEVSAIFCGTFPAMGIALFIINLPRLMLSVKKTDMISEAVLSEETAETGKNLLQFSTILMVFGICFALAATRLFPWERLGKYLMVIQFPWRLYLMASVCLAISGAIILNLYFSEKKAREYTLLAVICIMAVSAFSNMERTEEGYYSYSNDYFAYEPFTFNIVGGEWLPETVTDVEAIETTNDVAVTDSGKKLTLSRDKNMAIVDCAQETCEYVDIPMIYYKGYDAYYLNEDGTREALTVTGEGDNGYCRVMLQGIKVDQIIVDYRGTILQTVSYIISAVTLVCLSVILIGQFRRVKKGQTGQEEDLESMQ